MKRLQLTDIRGRLVLRNTVLNLAGSLLPVAVGVLVIPLVIKGLGVGRFGVLSLGWIILGYFSLFDFGLGRATTKFISEAIGREETIHISPLVWTSVSFQMCLGVVGALVLTAMTPLLVRHLLNIPPNLQSESVMFFNAMSAAIPAGICSVCFRGVLEAAHRFDLVNAVKVPLNCAVFVMPLAGLHLGYALPGVGLLLVGTQIIGALAYLFLCFRVFPELKLAFSVQRGLLKPLLSYGGWVTGYNLIIPVMMYLDRLIIGILKPIGMLTYYAVPYDMTSRVQILPSSLSTSLFPAFSHLGLDRKESLGELCTRSLKYLMLVMGPLTLILVLLARDILRIWLGPEFASQSTLIFQILAIGFLMNALGWPPTTSLLAVGRPDLVTKCYGLLLLPYAGLAWVLIHRYGLVGGALAMTIRETFQAGMFFLLYWRVMSLSFSSFTQRALVRGLLTSVSLIAALSGIILLGWQSGFSLTIAAVGLMASFLLVIWRYVLDPADLAELRAGLFNVLGREGNPK
jgi:O-antigen/teichoic acid export membrane protein